MTSASALDHDSYQELVRRVGPPRMRWLDPDEIPHSCLGFAVHLAIYQEKLVLVRNRQRDSWELPGGRREPGESIMATAWRELEEESGARRAQVLPCCCYRVHLGDIQSHGLLCLSLLDELPGPPPTSEIDQALAVDSLPGALCYPHIQGRMLEAWTRGCLQFPWKARPPALPDGLLSILRDSPPPDGEIPALSQNQGTWPAV